MLAAARRNVERAGLSGSIHLARRDAKATGEQGALYEAVVSNSIVHHIPDPRDVLAEMWRLVAPKGLIFVRDLARPESGARVDELVAKHAAIPTGLDAATRAIHERQRTLLADSLRAALTLDELRVVIVSIGLPPDAARLTSDRHWTLAHAKS
jgi:ubiquinone/menaquinone biosynthesis C-methylase UbiE